MLVGWTGHRPDVFDDPGRAQRRVVELANIAASRWKPIEFVCGGQRGVDQWAAQAGVALGIPTHLVLPTPIRRFTGDWPEHDQDALEALTQQITSLTVVDEAAQQGSLAYDRRNEAVVRRVGHLIAVWTGVRRGGTFYTLCAALTCGVSVESVPLPAAARFVVKERGL